MTYPNWPCSVGTVDTFAPRLNVKYVYRTCGECFYSFGWPMNQPSVWACPYCGTPYQQQASRATLWDRVKWWVVAIIAVWGYLALLYW